MRALIDSHVHFWQPQQLRYLWLDEVPAICRPFTPQELRQATQGVDLQKIVFVQADCVPEQGLDEVTWVSELARSEPRIQGIVAFAPLELSAPAITTYLDKLARFPLVKGVRRLIQSEGAGFAIRPEFIQGVQQLARYGYSFDICIVHNQMADAVQLVQQCPEVTFVLDHFGKPAIAAQQMEPWLMQVQALAALPNVWAKLSGLVTEADHVLWKPADLQPYIAHMLQCFGPARMLFGSDWPVVELAGTYERWVAAAVEATSHLSPRQQDDIFVNNAARIYRLA
jgi:L-fuconolactonase